MVIDYLRDFEAVIDSESERRERVFAIVRQYRSEGNEKVGEMILGEWFPKERETVQDELLGEFLSSIPTSVLGDFYVDQYDMAHRSNDDE